MTYTGFAAAAAVGLFVLAGANGLFGPGAGALAAESSSAQEVPEDDPWTERVTAILTDGGVGSSRSSTRRLAALGPDAVGAMFSVLVEDSLPAESAQAAQSLSSTHREDILRAFELLGPGAVLPTLESQLAQASDLESLATAIEVLGRVGHVADAPLGFHLAEGGMLGENLPLRLRDALGAALDLQLERFPDSIGTYAVAAAKGREAILASTAQAIGRLETHAALLTLGDLLGRNDRLDMLILSDMERCARAAAYGAPHSTARAVRRYLESRDPSIRAQACRTSMAMGDIGTLARLIELLEDEDESVVQAAHLALQRLSGANLPLDPSIWRAWEDEQMTWWRDEAPGLLRALRSGSPAKRVQALEDLAQGRLYRSELVEPLTELLSDAQPGVPPLACVVLGHLEARGAMQALSEALAQGDPVLATAARSAMRRIAKGRPKRSQPVHRPGPPALRATTLAPQPGTSE